MKKILIMIAWSLLTVGLSSGQVAINPSGGPPLSSAGLDVNYPDKGYLQPRLTGAQILAISNPDTGLMVYNMSSNKPVYFDGTSWRNFDGSSTWFGCGEPLEVNHITGSLAPVNKTVTYGTVEGTPGEPGKCWITSNLGASRQATAKNDATESSAGWYWQFNRLQGYKHDGTSRTPGTEWITSIGEYSNWSVAQDPCAVELGGRWRLPVRSEWQNSDAGGGWTDWSHPFASALKLHAAGYLAYSDGSITARGTSGHYWSSSHSGNTTGWSIGFSSGDCNLYSSNKAYAITVRCIQCPANSFPPAPESGSHVASANRIIWNWSPVTGATGYKWNKTNDYFSAEDVLNNTSKVENELEFETSYIRYIWAYDSCGYSSTVMLTDTTLPFVCGAGSLYIDHSAGAVAPVSKTVSYVTVTGVPGETSLCWIGQNLGADQQASAINDSTESSAGWYWQFNRVQGYKHDGTTVTPSWTITSITETSDWIPINDPCAAELGAGWRLPTETEWLNVDNAGPWTTWTGPWGSTLKLHAAGRIAPSNGALTGRSGSSRYGRYWSGTQENTTTSWALLFSSTNCYLNNDSKAQGYSVRCVQP